jgi:glucose/mannose-6-phosphate isomerase
VVAVPASIPQPRAAFGAMAVPPLVILERLGLLPGAGQQIEQAVDQLSRRRDQLVGPDSPADAVARRIGRTFALVHGGPGFGSVAAQRWKTQINENAKAPAFSAAQPELCHNEIVGWGQDGDVTRQVITLVTLRQSGEHPQVARRFDLISEIMLEVVADVVPVWAEGAGPLAQFFDLVLFGDFVSLHLAGHAGVDPGPVPILVEIKERLAAG